MGKVGGTSEAEKSSRSEATCTCGALIYWVTMATGSRMPIERGRESRVVYDSGEWRVLGTYMPHWAKCPDAGRHRGTGARGNSA